MELFLLLGNSPVNYLDIFQKIVSSEDGIYTIY